MSRVRVGVAVVLSAALAAVLGAPASAEAVQRTGTTAAGVPFVLDGHTLRITVPRATKRGRRIAVRCGRLTTADLLGPLAFPEAVLAEGSRRVGTLRRLRIRLDRDVSAIAEWCEFDTKPRGRSGAAVLQPKLAPSPAPLMAGPGVREGTARETGARFLVDGSTLTLLTTRPLPPDIVLFLACYAADPKEELRTIGARALAIGRGRREVSVDLGADIEGALSCFAEDAGLGGGGDLFITYFGAGPAR